jgi:hypothetical protein
VDRVAVRVNPEYRAQAAAAAQGGQR